MSFNYFVSYTLSPYQVNKRLTVGDLCVNLLDKISSPADIEILRNAVSKKLGSNGISLEHGTLDLNFYKLLE